MIIPFLILIKRKPIQYRESRSQIHKVSSLFSLLVHFRTSLTSYPSPEKLITLASLTQTYPCSNLSQPIAPINPLYSRPYSFQVARNQAHKTKHHYVNKEGIILSVGNKQCFNGGFLKFVFLLSLQEMTWVLLNVSKVGGKSSPTMNQQRKYLKGSLRNAY